MVLSPQDLLDKFKAGVDQYVMQTSLIASGMGFKEEYLVISQMRDWGRTSPVPTDLYRKMLEVFHREHSLDMPKDLEKSKKTQWGSSKPPLPEEIVVYE